MLRYFALVIPLLVAAGLLGSEVAVAQSATRPSTERAFHLHLLARDIIVTDEQGRPIKYASVEPVSANINGGRTYTDKRGHAVIPVSLAYIDRVQWVSITKDSFEDQYLDAPQPWPGNLSLKVVLMPETRPTTLPAHDKTPVAPSEAEITLPPRVATTPEEFVELCPMATAQDVKTSIHAGADANAKDRDGQTPLMAVVKWGDNPEVVAALLNAGADVNAKDKDGCTVLQIAAEWGMRNTVEVLLANKAEVNTKDRDGDTPLHRAAIAGSVKVVKLLLANKADVNAKNNGGLTPLHRAAEQGKVDVVEVLLVNKADVNGKDNKGQTPLHLAVANGRDLVVELLGEYGGVE